MFGLFSEPDTQDNGLLAGPRMFANALRDTYKQSLTGLLDAAATYLADTPNRVKRNVDKAFPDPRLLNPYNETPEAQAAREAVAGTALGFAAPITKYQHAHKIAQENATKMLGLPPNNTAMDRAKAMGFDVDGFHGMPTPMKGESFSPSMVAKNDYGAIGQGVYIDPSKDASYANAVASLLGNPTGTNILPVKVRSGNVFDASELPAIYNAERSKAVTEGLKQRGFNSVMSVVDGLPNEMMVIDPANIRSRFAAFDPARAHEADLLGYATPNMLAFLAGGAGLGGYLANRQP